MRRPISAFLVVLVTQPSNSLGLVTNTPFAVPKSVRTKSWAWEQGSDGEWNWQEDDPNFRATASPIDTSATATPRLPGGTFRPKQSLGQNYLKDPNTVARIIHTFHEHALSNEKPSSGIVELGPGAGALTDRLVENYGTDAMQCIEIDQRAIMALNERHPNLLVHHQDVLQADYSAMASQVGRPLIVIGNLPYYITSQILFALADASHSGAVHSATVTMQWEVAQRMVAPTRCKDYGILSVVFQLYADVTNHFKIPPTVFYPVPKVDSALVGLHFVGPSKLRQRLAGVDPAHFRQVVTTAFRQRRKTVRNSLKKLNGVDMASLDAQTNNPLPPSVLLLRQQGDAFAQIQELPKDWLSKRPEELSPGQFVEVTRLLFGSAETDDLGAKVWRKVKHGR